MRILPLAVVTTATLSIALLAFSTNRRAHAEATSGGANFAVVELFTSEGCSSCPPADEVLWALEERAQKEGLRIFPLSFHVDYWDYLGWDDPFSSQAFSSRQRSYARALGGRGVYTPQMVVNGKHEFVGSKRGVAHRTIKKVLNQSTTQKIALKLERGANKKELLLSYQLAMPAPGSVLNIAVTSNERGSRVTAGENRGRTLRHANVVHRLITRKLGTGTKDKLTIALDAATLAKNPTIFAYVQKQGSLEITAAERATF